jgi:hypothetical protein
MTLLSFFCQHTTGLAGKMRRLIPVCLLPLFLQQAVSGQHTSETITLQGQVADKTTGTPVEMATIHIFRAGSGKLAGYTFTDEKGRFSLPVKPSDSLQISVSMLGYKTHKETVARPPGETLRILLEQQVFHLREVQVRPGRVWGRQDTIHYDVSQFASEKDESIKDVIKKLPGINVDDAGKISYNGKDISNFYVEGMDLSGGKYGKITHNLDARSVETVQLIQNHQPVRVLQKKVSTEDIAMNLKLKPEFRDQWMFSVQEGAGFPPLLWNASGHAMQLSRKSQSAYTYKSNNTGQDVVDEQLMLVPRFSGRVREPDVSSFLHQPSIMAPLKKERLLFNRVHTVSGNRLYKLSETAQLRLNADYTHDVRKQERGSETFYFYPGDTLLLAEQSHTRIQSDEAALKIHLENNAAEKFLTNELDISGSRQKSDATISGNKDVSQQIKTPNIKLRNHLRCLWNKSAHTYEVHSLLRYDHRPSELTTDDLKQHLNINSYYADHYFSLLHKKGAFTQQYSAGFRAEGSNLQNRYGAYLNPLWQMNTGKWQTHLSVPLILTLFSDMRIRTAAGFPFTRLQEANIRAATNPSVSVLYKPDYAWRFLLSAKYDEQYGNVTELYALPYFTDYRHLMINNGILPVLQTQNYTAYGEYKNTVNEFFTTLSLHHSRNRSNLTQEQRFEQERIIHLFHETPTTSTTHSIRGTVSKGFYDLKMKLSLDYLFSHTRSQQIHNGERMPFRLSYMQYEPKLSQSITRNLEVAYEANIRYGGSTIGGKTKLTPLWNTTQKLQLNYILSDFELNLSADHYHNDINGNQSVDACFVDASFKWKQGGWQFIASANNLFDKQQYGYTQYSTFQSYTSRIHIRGREFLLSAKYKF